MFDDDLWRDKYGPICRELLAKLDATIDQHERDEIDRQIAKAMDEYRDKVEPK